MNCAGILIPIHDPANDPRLHLPTMPCAHFSTAVLETLYLKGAAGRAVVFSLLGMKNPAGVAGWGG
jgi:hypothetical protein